MKSRMLVTLLLGALSATATNAQAAYVYFNDLTNAGTIGRTATSKTFASKITVTATQSSSGSPKYLTVANFAYPNASEVGLGVCGSSDTSSLCAASLSGNSATEQLNLASGGWTGDVTELDNAGDTEGLTVAAASGWGLTGKFVLGSLDQNDTTTNDEDGFITYTNTNGASATVRFKATTDAKGGAAITQGNATIQKAGTMDGHVFGVEVFLLTINDFRTVGGNAVVFGAGGLGDSGTNNDYLVTAADVVTAANMAPVPLPAALYLLGSGMGLLSAMGRRRRRQGAR